MNTKLLTIALLLASTALFSQIIEPTRYNLDSLGFHTNNKDYKYDLFQVQDGAFVLLDQ